MLQHSRKTYNNDPENTCVGMGFCCISAVYMGAGDSFFFSPTSLVPDNATVLEYND